MTRPDFSGPPDEIPTMHALHSLAFFPIVLCSTLAHAREPLEPQAPARIEPRADRLLELWPEAAPRRDFVLEFAERSRARDELLMLTAAATQPCARFTHRPLPFFATHTNTRPYAGVGPMGSFRLETCLRQAHGQGYENRTPLIPLACSFVDFGVHVKIALDPAGTDVLQEFDAMLPPRTYPRLGYDSTLDFNGVSGVYEQLATAQRDQRIFTLDAEEEMRFRAPFTVYVSVSMMHGTIAGMGAYTARVDGDGTVLVQADVNGDGVIAPGGEPSPNGASLAIVFHWGDTVIAP